MRLQRLADEGLTVDFAPFDVLAVDASVPPGIDVLAAITDLAETAVAEGVPLRRPRVLPPTARAHLIGELAEEHGLGASWRQTAYTTFWSDGRDLNDPAVLLDLAEQAGLGSDVVRA